VIYRSNLANNITAELYLVNIDGSGGSTKVSGAMASGGNVGSSPGVSFGFTPDSSKVIYIADEDTDGVDELYMNTVTNAGVVKLSGIHGSGANVVKFQALNNKVVFLGDLITDNINDLFSADFTGLVTKLNSALVLGEQVRDFIADSNNVAYLMDQGSSGVYSVYGNSLNGGSELLLSQALTGGGLGAYEVGSPALKQVLMLNGQVLYRSAVSSGNYQGYRVSVTGGSIETMTDESTGGSMLFADVSLGSSIAITPDGNYMVYRMNISGKANLLSSRLH
jgi:hypothetical protein